ncbi:MAG: hypothetical protein A2X11_09965 [Bacteroidetes bacterium GWE2_42_24]|nr:MAG: hypothetical protein A2X11_09965 [Bacteroidetes bacterium GWE2_42_24]OFY25895.1 MAG: hypothetical protein A2X09_09340 [Bacteroidetes bacterium GWF2_43_11]
MKRHLAFIIAIPLFLLITYLSFRPAFSGKVIHQSDIIQHKGMSKELADFREAGNGEALWTNSMFGGMPAYQISTIYTGNWMSHLDRIMHLYLPHPAGYIFMCFMGFFILLLCLEISPWLALAGALAYGFSSYFFIILEVGHNSKANAIGYLAPVLGGIILLMRRKYWSGFAVSVLFLALELNANHVQITYYGFMVFALVFAAYLIRALKEKAVKSFFIGAGLFVLAGGIGFLPNAGSLLATSEYSKFSTRGQTELTIDENMQSNSEDKTSGLDKSYAVQYSHGIWETFTFLIPNFKGGKSSAIGNTDENVLQAVDPDYRKMVANGDSYFGDQGGTSGPVYIGAIIIFLAILGLFVLDHILKWPLLIATVLCMMLSWGKFFMGLSNFFLDYIPGYDKFRAVSMILVIAELTLPLLAILTVDKLIKVVNSREALKIPFLKKQISVKRAFLISFIAVGGFCLIGYLMPRTVNSFSPPDEESKLAQLYKKSGASEGQIAQFLPVYLLNLQKARIGIFKKDAIRSFIFISLAALILYLFITRKITKEILFAGLGFLFVVDLWPIASRYLNGDNFVNKAQFESSYALTRADQEILKDKSLDYRVLNLSVSPFMDGTTSYHHKSIGGYHGAKLKKYDELISFHLVREIEVFSKGIGKVSDDSTLSVLTSQLPVINMLNTKYIIYPGREDAIAIPNSRADGNAWFIKTLKTVKDADAEIISLYNLDTRNEAVIQQKFRQSFPAVTDYSDNGKIVLKSYKPNDLVYEAQVDDKGFAVFSEIYYPDGWNAYMDGNLMEYYCVNYLLRGMEVPAGKHLIEFKFEPVIYQKGNAIALIGSILVLISVFGALAFALKKRELTV